MRPESIAGAFDLNDDGVMQQPIQQSGGDHGVAEHVSPFGKASIGGENHGTFFVASTDQLKEQIGAFPGQWQVADLIDDEQRSSGIESKFVGELSGAMGQRQGIDQVGQGASVDAFAGFDGGYAERTSQMVMLSSTLFPGLFPRPSSLSARLVSALCQSVAPVAGTDTGQSRWQLCQDAERLEQYPTVDSRRLGNAATE